jgi:hypothetical protein
MIALVISFTEILNYLIKRATIQLLSARGIKKTFKKGSLGAGKVTI